MIDQIAQWIAVGIIVVIAVVCIVKRIRHKDNGCGSCGNCPSKCHCEKPQRYNQATNNRDEK
jgi:hypothetical protein